MSQLIDQLKLVGTQIHSVQQCVEKVSTNPLCPLLSKCPLFIENKLNKCEKKIFNNNINKQASKQFYYLVMITLI